jgi:hypothetical protein
LADAVTSQILVDGARNTVMKFTNISDGSGESAVAKVTVSNLVGAPSRVAIKRIQAVTFGMGIDILWDATTDVIAYHVPENQFVDHDFTSFGGIPNNAGAGVTGNILFTTVGAAANDRYTIILWVQKT